MTGLFIFRIKTPEYKLFEKIFYRADNDSIASFIKTATPFNLVCLHIDMLCGAAEGILIFHFFKFYFFVVDTAFVTAFSHDRGIILFYGQVCKKEAFISRNKAILSIA